MKFVPKIGKWFHAFVTKTKAVNGFKCDILTRCGPYKCTRHVKSSTTYVQTVLAKDKSGTDFKFLCNLFRFEERKNEKT